MFMLKTGFSRPLIRPAGASGFPGIRRRLSLIRWGSFVTCRKNLSATLEELSQADLLLHVIDISNPNFKEQMSACERILADLDLHNIPTIRVFNKEDRFFEKEILANLCRMHNATAVSALHPATLLPLVERIELFFVDRFVPSVDGFQGGHAAGLV
jgi:hypothetical protein